MSRSRYSLYNAVAAVIKTLINGLFGIISTRIILLHYGSDFNGLNSTVNQIINVLLVLEGGFTVASNVALFGPISSEDYKTANEILVATRKSFRRIGILFFSIGAAVSVGYSFFVKSNLSTEFIITAMMLAVFPNAFKLYYDTTYRVILQAQQKEYVLSIITACTVGLGHVSNIVLALSNGPMWQVRFNTMAFTVLNSFIVAYYVKKHNKFIDFNAHPKPELIKGTNDVMVQKVTRVIYTSAPIIFLTVSPTGGTILASVYAVYYSVFDLIKSFLSAVIDAPRLSFGQILTERKKSDIWRVFVQYEYAAFSAIFVFLTTASALIMPFIKIYLNGVNDANYTDVIIAIFMVLITFVGMLYIPSDHLLNMAGLFRISRNFQLVACIVLVILMAVGGTLWGIYGMLASVLIVAVLLCILEMGYIHTKFFEKKLWSLMRLMLPLIVVGIIACVLEMQLPININGYISFLVHGVLFVCINGIIALAVGFVFNRKEITALINRILRIVNK